MQSKATPIEMENLQFYACASQSGHLLLHKRSLTGIRRGGEDVSYR
jgi:hypothetical protein